jgi:hypothetical protein
MDILFWISLLGEGVCVFLWLRDIRIWIRTNYPGYKKAALDGVGYTAVATLGTGITYNWPEFSILGAGIVLLALYLQGKEKKEKIWKNEPPIVRFFGSVPRKSSKR